MAYDVVVTPSANADLDSIIEYISVKLANPSAASAFLNNVTKCYEELSVSPKMYEQCRDVRLKKLGYRRAIIGNYILVYRVDEINMIVYVLRYFYGAREYAKLI